jgi:hypothetical protein
MVFWSRCIAQRWLSPCVMQDSSWSRNQLLNYLRCSVIEVGLILNFGPNPKVRRLVFGNQRKHPSFSQHQ